MNAELSAVPLTVLCALQQYLTGVSSISELSKYPQLYWVLTVMLNSPDKYLSDYWAPHKKGGREK